MPHRPSPNKAIAAGFVFIQMLLLVLIALGALARGRHASAAAFVSGIGLVVIGTGGVLLSARSIRRSLTVMPLPLPDGQLATGGLYRFVRHPMYTSVLLAALGVAIASSFWMNYLLVVGLAVLFYCKSRYEEYYLRDKYPAYAAYAATTPRFLPRLRLRR